MKRCSFQGEGVQAELHKLKHIQAKHRIQNIRNDKILRTIFKILRLIFQNVMIETDEEVLLPARKRGAASEQ